MKLREVHNDVERYLAEDCYCPNEVYSVDGFCYQLVFADADCKVIGTFKNPNGTDDDITFCITASGKKHDHPILLNIWHTEEKVESMERYEYSDQNIREITAWLKGESKMVTLSEADDLKKSVAEIMSYADAFIVS